MPLENPQHVMDASNSQFVENLNVGSRIYAQDVELEWYTATVVETSPHGMQIGSKIFVFVDIEGKKLQIHFDDWDSEYDEWINRDSNRIQPLTSCQLLQENIGQLKK